MPNPKAEAAAKMLGATPRIETVQESDYLSLGIIPLNLAVHGRINGGVQKGRIYRLNGRPSGGKTFVARTILAEACINPAFEGYQLVYDDVEEGALMDTEKFFGKQLVKRLQPPAWYAKSRRPYYSRFVTECFNRIRKRMEDGKRIIWIIDSLDALRPDGDKTTKMTDNKAKVYSQEIRRLMDPVMATKSIIVLISQARANMDAGPFDDEDITAGGRALDHYPSVDIRLRKQKSLRTPYKGVKFVTGSIIRAQVKKNRISGRDYTVFFPFYPTYGIDNIGACVDYLFFMKHWKKVKEEKYDVLEVNVEDGDDENSSSDTGNSQVAAPEFGFKGTKQELIQHIESNELEQELNVLTGKVWKEIEATITPERKPRYS